MRIVDFRTYLADCLMPKVDVTTMAHGLEVRAPLLDQEVVALAISLPSTWLSDRHGGKQIMRALARRYLPPDIIDRPKQGFEVPLADWFRHELRPVVENLPTNSILAETGWFQVGGLRRIIQEHMSGGRNHAQRITTCSCFANG